MKLSEILSEQEDRVILLSKRLVGDVIDITISINRKRYVYGGIPKNLVLSLEKAIKKGTGFSALEKIKPYYLGEI